MEHGHYWLQLKDEEPEVVEIDGDAMYRCGSDVTCRFEDAQWIEFGEPMEVVSITGPIIFGTGDREPLKVGNDERRFMNLDDYDEALVSAVAKIEIERDELLLALERVLPFLTGNYWPGVEADPAVGFAIASARKARDRKIAVMTLNE